MPDSDDPFGEDAEIEKFADDFERHRAAIYERLSDYMDEEDLSEAYMAQLLIEAAIRMRMSAYGLGVESPSVAGLKIDLDRLGAEVGEILREAKKGAAEYIALVKKMRAEMEAEDWEENEKGDE